MKGQVTIRKHERKDLWEVWAASPADSLRTCRDTVAGGAEGSSTYWPMEDQEGARRAWRTTMFGELVPQVRGGWLPSRMVPHCTSFDLLLTVIEGLFFVTLANGSVRHGGEN